MYAHMGGLIGSAQDLRGLAAGRQFYNAGHRTHPNAAISCLGDGQTFKAIQVELSISPGLVRPAGGGRVQSVETTGNLSQGASKEA
jgi:hypothetical protein